jgi:AcrR family transcriptional regulator
MSDPGLLHHFASKEELLLELLKLRDQHDDERIAEARAAHAHVLDVLLALCRQNQERPGIVRLFTILAAESVDDDPAHDWPRPLRRAPHVLTDRLAKAQREGTVDADLDPESVASQILAMFDGLQPQWLLTRPRSTWRRCSRISWRGCGRGGGRPRRVRAPGAPSVDFLSLRPDNSTLAAHSASDDSATSRPEPGGDMVCATAVALCLAQERTRSSRSRRASTAKRRRRAEKLAPTSRSRPRVPRVEVALHGGLIERTSRPMAVATIWH